MTSLRESSDDLLILCRLAAEHFRLPEASFAEKDLWVVEALRSVMRPIELQPTKAGQMPTCEVIFKGGTSLSKVFGIVERFSEDIDLLVVASEGLGETAIDNQILKFIATRAANDIGVSSKDIKRESGNTGVNRDVSISYPSFIASSAVAPTIRLEMGVRGGTTPGLVNGTVQSFVGQYLDAIGDDVDWDERLPVDVVALSPVRTLVEKLSLLHNASTDDLPERQRNQLGRHLYDVWRLLGNADVVAELSSVDVPSIAGDVVAFSRASFGACSDRPEAGYSASPVWAKPFESNRQSALSIARGLVYGAFPTDDECVRRVQDCATLL
jgi:hypothetical protein